MLSVIGKSGRDTLPFDFAVVGGGPAGLSAAIRLKQMLPKASVAVLEKGASCGAHNVSGCVLDPIALVAMLLGCMWLLTLSIGYGAMSISIFVLLAFVYMKIFSFAYGHGMGIQTMTMILLVNAIILLPVSWLMFIRKKYDKFVCFSQNVNG